jgi:uncharacterized membrane protein
MEAALIFYCARQPDSYKAENPMPHDNIPVPAKAAIAGHPIHPALVSFPIAFLTGALLTDIAALALPDPFWARASLLLIGAGLVAGLAAYLFGLIDFLGSRPIREHTISWLHLGFNTGALLLSAINLALRLANPSDTVSVAGLALSAAVAVALTISGWLGGEMAFRHKFGVAFNKDNASHVVDKKIDEDMELELYKASTPGD